MNIREHLLEALRDAKEEPKSREMSLVITKIEEAIHWLDSLDYRG